MKKKILIVLVLTLGLAVEVANADFIFGTPTKVPNVNSSSRDFNASISADGLSLFFISTRSGGVGGTDIWVTTRETTEDTWDTPVNLGPTINTSGGDGGVSISSDGLSLYFSSTRSSGYGSGDLWITTRDTISNEWGTPMNLGSMVNSSSDQCYPSISSDELELYFASNVGGGIGRYDIWVTTRTTTDDGWGEPVNLGATVNSSAYDVDPGISADGRTLFFASTRSGGYGSATDDLWVTRRVTSDDDWGEPVNLGPIINSSAWENYPIVSADGSTLFYHTSQSGRNSSGDLWQASIIPIVDLNGDCKVDLADMHIMVDHWGENYALCDIGPTPLGDGIVDIQDFIVLTEHLYRLATHWKLDETDGNIAYDSVGDYDGTVNGNPFWQPTGGVIDGSLMLDGIDDYIYTPFILDPSKESFSVFAWVYSWMPGQVIISQTGELGGTWLGIDSTGKLMTGLVPPRAGSLVSESVITDIQWHHVGFVWDGSYRALYVDGIEVAKDDDAQDMLNSTEGGLYIGASKDLEAGSLFSGFIDDVRIYKQALTTEEIAALAQ
jgi:Tol biopolymer transport system component